MGEELFIKLRYCFQSGYTLPQYCIDNNIKRPLFVMEETHEWFLRELHAQFKLDNILSARFCFIDGAPQTTLKLTLRVFGTKIKIKNISGEKISRYDAVIFLTEKEYDVGNTRIIRLKELEKFCIQRTYVDIPLLNFLQRNPKVKLFLTSFPSQINRYEGGAEYGSQLWVAGDLIKAIREGKQVNSPFDKLGYTNAQALEILSTDKAVKNLDGTTSLVDNELPLMNIQNGRRATAYQPEHFRNKIYFFGPCHIFGRNAPFDKTIESYLQKLLNENNLPYRVENYGQAFSERTQDIFYNLNALNLKPNDIIFFNFWRLHSNNDLIPFCDVNDAFDPPHDYKEIFCTKNHVNELGYKLVAEKYFKFLTENNFFRDVEFNYHTPPPPITDMVYHRNSSRAA